MLSSAEAALISAGISPGRAPVVRAVVDRGLSKAAAKPVAKWGVRFNIEGVGGLHDRSSSVDDHSRIAFSKIMLDERQAPSPLLSNSIRAQRGWRKCSIFLSVNYLNHTLRPQL